MGEWGFQFLTGLKGKASWPAVLSAYCDHFLPFVARRLSVSRPAKVQRRSDREQAARAALEASWDTAFDESMLREIEPALAIPVPEVVPVPIVSNSLVVWVGPHAARQPPKPHSEPVASWRRAVRDGCKERVAHYINCPPEDEARRLPAAFFESLAALATPSTAQGSRRSM
eukprot:6920568-Prymnesium_polylepis.1